MNIKITDERIEQIIPVSRENIKCEVVETEEQAFKTLDDKGLEKEVVLNVVKPTQTTTLKDLIAQIGEVESDLAYSQSNVDIFTAELAKLNALKVEMEALVQSAFDANVIAVAEKPVETPVEPLPTKTPVEEVII